MTTDFIAYFSMEIALELGTPTYSGGLGVLVGDTIRSAAGQPERPKEIATRAGRRETVFGGKTHPRHDEGRRVIQHLARNAAHFNTQRMVQEYVAKACSCRPPRLRSQQPQPELKLRTHRS